MTHEAPTELKRNDLERQRETEKDPFSAVESGAERAKRVSQAGLMASPEIVPLNQEVDCPDGFVVSETVWNRLQVRVFINAWLV